MGPIFKDIRNSFTDCTIKCDDYRVEYDSHRVVLSTASPFLANLIEFSNG